MNTTKILNLIICICLLQNANAQISEKKYKRPEEQTFYVSNDTISQKFKAHVPQNKIKTKTFLYYTWFKYNQVFSTQGGYDGRLLDGDYICSYRDNNLKTKGTYKDGLKVNVWYDWYPNGNLMCISEWRKGQRYGTSLNYNLSGRLTNRESYKKGLLNGKCIVYQDSSVKVTYYKNGILKAPKSKLIKSKRDKPVTKEISNHKEVLSIKPLPQDTSAISKKPSTSFPLKNNTTPLPTNQNRFTNTPAQTPKQ